MLKSPKSSKKIIYLIYHASNPLMISHYLNLNFT